MKTLQEDYSKIKILGKRLSLLTKIGLIFLPIGISIWIYNITFVGIPVPLDNGQGTILTTQFSKIGLSVVLIDVLINLSISIFILLKLRKISTQFLTEDHFDTSTITFFKQLSTIAMCWIIYNFIFSLLQALILSATGDMPMTHSIWIELSGFDFVSFIASYLFRIFAEVVEEGIKLKKELDLTV